MQLVEEENILYQVASEELISANQDWTQLLLLYEVFLLCFLWSSMELCQYL